MSAKQRHRWWITGNIRRRGKPQHTHYQPQIGERPQEPIASAGFTWRLNRDQNRCFRTSTTPALNIGTRRMFAGSRFKIETPFNVSRRAHRTVFDVPRRIDNNHQPFHGNCPCSPTAFSSNTSIPLLRRNRRLSLLNQAGERPKGKRELIGNERASVAPRYGALAWRQPRMRRGVERIAGSRVETVFWASRWFRSSSIHGDAKFKRSKSTYISISSIRPLSSTAPCIPISFLKFAGTGSQLPEGSGRFSVILSLV